MNFIKRLVDVYIKDKEKPQVQVQKRFFAKSLAQNIACFETEFDKSADLSIRYLNIGGINSAVITIGGMVDKGTLSTGVLVPITSTEIKGKTASEKYEYVRDVVTASAEQVQVSNFDDAFNLVMSGFALIAMDECDSMLALGLQGFPFRGIAEPSSEIMQRGSREGLVEPLMINMTMIRRRLKNTKLKFELSSIGTVSKTAISLCYLTDKVSESVLEELREKLAKVDLETVMESGYVIPYLEDKGDFSLFSSIGMTERPDTICGKISEGRIAILIDGTPNALIVPYLFVEYFQHLDDYSMRPYFSTLTRWLKYIAFFMSILLPGLYVGISTFNPEMLPGPILNKIALAVGTTPFSLMTETIIIHLIYETMREAGLRVPKPLAHAVGIVGGLVIGETAVSSGLIGGPTLMVVALTAIASYVIPNLYEPVATLKFVFIIAGGLLGVWGIMIIFTAVLINICSKNSYGIPFTSPVAPFNMFAMRDVFLRLGWKILSKKHVNVQDMPGSEVVNK